MISIVVKMIQDLEAWQDRKRTWHTTGAALRRAFPFVQDQDQDFVLLAGLSRCMDVSRIMENDRTWRRLYRRCFLLRSIDQT